MSIKKSIIKTFMGGIAACLCMACGGNDSKDYWGDISGGEDEEPTENPNASKPRYIWIDAAANFPDFVNSRENIAYDLALAKNADFIDIVVDVCPTTDDVLFKTNLVDQVKLMYAWVGNNYIKVERTATWDYLQAFVDEACKQGLRIRATINTFVGGNQIDGGTGLLYRDQSKAERATQMNMRVGITSVTNTSESTKFFSPTHPKVQTFPCGLLKGLADYDLDGMFLDRGRFLNLQADFFEESRKQFEEYMGGIRIQNYPNDILAPGASSFLATYPKYLTKWLEFHAKMIYDFVQRAHIAVKGVEPGIRFGVYVGGWYFTYYDVGVNWAASTYDTSRYYNWVTSRYRNYGYAACMDQILVGAYASPLKVRGTTEQTMESFCSLVKDKMKGECPIVAGGPDIGNRDTNNQTTQEQENQATVQSVKACMDVCDGYFLFDMIHLKKVDQQRYTKEGIKFAIE